LPAWLCTILITADSKCLLASQFGIWQMLWFWGQYHQEDCAEAALPELQALLSTQSRYCLISPMLSWIKYVSICFSSVFPGFLCHRGANILRLLETRRARVLFQFDMLFLPFSTNVYLGFELNMSCLSWFISNTNNNKAFKSQASWVRLELKPNMSAKQFISNMFRKLFYQLRSILWTQIFFNSKIYHDYFSRCVLLSKLRHQSSLASPILSRLQCIYIQMNMLVQGCKVILLI
jgi:hypothetical protein